MKKAVFLIFLMLLSSCYTYKSVANDEFRSEQEYRLLFNYGTKRTVTQLSDKGESYTYIYRKQEFETPKYQVSAVSEKKFSTVDTIILSVGATAEGIVLFVIATHGMLQGIN